MNGFGWTGDHDVLQRGGVQGRGYQCPFVSAWNVCLDFSVGMWDVICGGQFAFALGIIYLAFDGWVLPCFAWIMLNLSNLHYSLYSP